MQNYFPSIAKTKISMEILATEMVGSCETTKGTPAVQSKRTMMAAASFHCDPQEVVWHEGIQGIRNRVYHEI